MSYYIIEKERRIYYYKSIGAHYLFLQTKMGERMLHCEKDNQEDLLFIDDPGHVPVPGNSRICFGFI